jgi:hypothetical protein
VSTLQKYTPFLASALLMCGVLFIIYPHYQYYIDPDGTAYLTISQRYANGDFAKAINGYWSPWSCWLTALLIKTGLGAMPASVVINAIGAAGVLFITQSFLLHFDIAKNLQWLLNITLALFMCYAVFWQSFDDLWEVFFLLCALRIMIADDFKSNPGLWIICGVVGTLSYFAKAYSFPFFILNMVVCSYFIVEKNKTQWLKISFTTIGVMILCSMPWIWLLHNKYGIWTTSTSGTLNTSWYLVGHPYWKDGIDLLLPPPYPDSPYYWEDPWYVNGVTPHFWSSWHLLGLQMLRIGYNFLKLLGSMAEVSVLFPIVVLFVARFIFTTYKNREIAHLSKFIFVLSFLLFPLGYLPVNFGPARYIWYMMPMSMIAGILFVIIHLNSNKKIARAVPYLFALTYLVYPAWQMIKMYDEGKREYETAQLLKQNKIQGSFTSNAKPGLQTQQIVRLAYFSGNTYYASPKADPPQTEIVKEIKCCSVNYYFLYGSSTDNSFLDENGKPFPELHIQGIKDMKIFKVN